MVNKVNELNPEHEKFNPQLFALFMQAQQRQPVIRTNDSTTVLPTTGTNLHNDISGAPTGIGSPPAASDGPVIHPGPTGSLRDAETKVPDEALLALFFGAFFLTEEDYEELWWDVMSGSGGYFGYCTGVDCQYPFGNPGYPFGGPPIGSWVHHDRSLANFRFNNDSSFQQDVRNGNFTALESSLGNQVGNQVRHDPRGHGF